MNNLQGFISADPEGWTGTPGEWLPMDNEECIQMGVGKHISLWPKQYSRPGGGHEMQANIAAICRAKDLIRLLEPLAEKGRLCEEMELNESEGVRLKMTVGELIEIHRVVKAALNL